MRRYKFRNLVFDCLMVFLTGGIWLIWMFNREMRARHAY
jgi:hypothetical protein